MHRGYAGKLPKTLREIPAAGYRGHDSVFRLSQCDNVGQRLLSAMVCEY